MEIIAQVFGIIASILAIVSYQFKRKWQILGLCSAANACSATNFLLLGNAGVMVANCYVAAIQCAINAVRDKLGKKEAGIAEKIIAFLVFVVIGLVPYKSLLDLMPLAATMFFVLSTFQKNEQTIRVIIFFNTAILLVYSWVMGSSVVVGHAFSLVSIVVSYIRERKASEQK